MRVIGVVRDIERREVDGAPTTTFWLEQEGGRKTCVEAGRGQQVTTGEALEVEGRLNSEGMLVADRIARPLRAEQPPAPAPAPPPVEPPKPAEGRKLVIDVSRMAGALAAARPAPAQVKKGVKIAGVALMVVILGKILLVVVALLVVFVILRLLLGI